MRYFANITKDDNGSWLVDFPDCPGCVTFGDTREEAIELAQEALEGWLEANLIHGSVPPRPKRHIGALVVVPPRLALSLQLRWLRDEQKLTQAELARKLGVSQQAIAKLEKPDSNPTIGTVIDMVEALQGVLELTVKPKPQASTNKIVPNPSARLRFER